MKVLLLILISLLSLLESIHIIDVAPLLNGGTGSEFDNVTHWIDFALAEEGIFLAVGHGISSENREMAFSAAEALFSFDDSVKREHKLENVRGFIPYAGESGLRRTVFEPKEGFSYGFHWDTHVKGPRPSIMHAANVFPPLLASQEAERLDWHRAQCAKLADRLSSAISSLPSNAKALNGHVAEGGDEISVMRIFHYFPLTSPETQSSLAQNLTEVQVLGSAPHTDWGYLTIIMENGEGLQFWKNDIGWVDVGHTPNALIVNGGDYLSLHTRRRYKSPIHRVLCPQDLHRISFVYFAYPGAQSTIPIMYAEEESVEVTADGGAYNTLLNQGQVEGESFAELIARKWSGVYKPE